MALSRREREYWRSELRTLDKQYEKRRREWQKTIALYDMKFESFRSQMDRLGLGEIIPISRFYPLVRQIIASVALNYPKLFFSIDDDDSDGVEEVLERAADRWFHLASVKEHVHQAIFDALTCSVGWLRLDYNPPGDDMIPPYVTNDAMHEDLVSVTRVSPVNVRIDPVGSPHILGHRRYIDEVMWVPLEFLKKDDSLKEGIRDKIRPTLQDDQKEWGNEITLSEDDDDREAERESLQNGEFVKIHRVHDRIGKRLITFVDGMFEEIKVEDHPFRKLVFPQAINPFDNQPLFDENGEPVLDLENGQAAPGWLVKQGFPFVPVKFDLHADSFYPKAHLKYVEAIQLGIVEAVTREAAILRRTARQGLANRSELEANPNVLDGLRKGVDGEWTAVEDVNAFKELNYGNVPQDLYTVEDRLRFYEDQITQVTELQRGGGPRRTATESSLLATAANVNRDWIDASVSRVYADLTESAFRIMGDPRYTPENFIVNTSPTGQIKLSRALKSADFLWNFRIKVQAGSAQPLFERLQREDSVEFYDRAIGHPLADQAALFKHLAKAYDIPDPERLMIDQVNADAQGLAQYENDTMVTGLQDPGVLPEQDHEAHHQTHAQYQNHPVYIQLLQQAQMEQAAGMMGVATQRLQIIDQLMAQHKQAHDEAMNQVPQPKSSKGAPDVATDTLINMVRGNAQDVSNAVAGQGQDLYQ